MSGNVFSISQTATCQVVRAKDRDAARVPDQKHDEAKRNEDNSVESTNDESN